MRKQADIASDSEEDDCSSRGSHSTTYRDEDDEYYAD